MSQAPEQQHHLSSKMEAIARLAGGVSHQFNNLLTAILATTDLALTSSDLEASVRSDLQDIREAGKRAAAVTRQLLAFSGNQSMSLRPTSVNHVLQQLEPLLKHVLPANVTLDLELRSASIVSADPMRLEQIVVTLVVNAADALPTGGSITITTQDVELPSAESQGFGAGPFTEIVVADKGRGMDDKTRARLFEPFFSTKGHGAGGIGLGLASVYGTMRQFGGAVVVESALGAGTSVRLFIPRPRATGAFVRTTTPRNNETIPAEVVLVVEDEPVVRSPICRALRNLGYFVLEANSGEDALRVMQEHHSPIHLVLTDVMMPQMDGAALVQLLRDWYPRMRVLFITGYPQHLEELGMVSGKDFLEKPFPLQSLTKRVREILDMEWGERDPA